MFTAGTVWFVLAMYGLMIAGFFLSRHRWIHMPLMSGLIAIDLGFPFYLYLTKDWYRRLIVHEDIFSFLVWMHFGLIITLYVLYFFQVKAAYDIAQGTDAARVDHRSQGKAILLTKGLVIMTGALLVQPDPAPQ